MAKVGNRVSRYKNQNLWSFLQINPEWIKLTFIGFI